MMNLSDLESGSSIFIDANIFIYHFSKDSKFNPASSDFLERVESREVHGFTSIPVVQEVTHRMMIIEAAAILVEIKPKDLVKYLKKHPEVVQKLVTHQSIPAKIRSFNLEIISPDIETLVRSQQMKRKYGFLSNDALSVQILEDLSINNLATNDSDFERVDIRRRNFTRSVRESELPIVPFGSQRQHNFGRGKGQCFHCVSEGG